MCDLGSFRPYERVSGDDGGSAVRRPGRVRVVGIPTVYDASLINVNTRGTSHGCDVTAAQTFRRGAVVVHDALERRRGTCPWKRVNEN